MASGVDPAAETLDDFQAVEWSKIKSADKFYKIIVTKCRIILSWLGKSDDFAVFCFMVVTTRVQNDLVFDFNFSNSLSIPSLRMRCKFVSFWATVIKYFGVLSPAILNVHVWPLILNRILIIYSCGSIDHSRPKSRYAFRNQFAADWRW